MDDWPGNWGRDKGIDLIARKYDGQIVAIQAKHCGRVAADRNRCEALARRHRTGRLKVYRDHPQPTPLLRSRSWKTLVYTTVERAA